MKITIQNDESLHFRITSEPLLKQTKSKLITRWQISVPVEITEGGKREIKLRRIVTFDLNGTPKTFTSEMKSEKETGSFEKDETLTMESAMFNLINARGNACDLLSVRIEAIS